MAATEFCSLVDEMAAGISSVRVAVKALNSLKASGSFDTKDGISLLSLKHYALISYLTASLTLSARRVLGDSLTARTGPPQPFSTIERAARGNGSGDLVDFMIETRIVLEKIQMLEARMRYQIEKLVRLAQEPENITATASDHLDPLSFRANPQNLVNKKTAEDRTGNDQVDHSDIPAQQPTESDGIYHPPRVAPMPYTGATSSKKSKSQLRKERPPVPSTLSLLTDTSLPYSESTSGLGGSTNFTSSGRASYLKRMTEFEEDNFSRLVLKKSEARRRARDEASLALGGSLSGLARKKGWKVPGELEDQFGDVLRSVERGGNGLGGIVRGDGYDDLRNHGKETALERSRKREATSAFQRDDEGSAWTRTKKKSRFELEAKTTKRKLLKNSR